MGDTAQPAPEAMPGMPDPMGCPPDQVDHSANPVPPAGEAFQGVPEASPEPVAPNVSPDEGWTPPDPAVSAPMPQAQPVSADDVRAQPLPRINIQAFCEDQNTANILNQASKDRRLSKTHVSVQMGGMNAASHYYLNAPTPNLIIIESMHNRDAMVMDVDRLASVCDTGTKVIVIGHVNDVLLYRELLARGVSEYLVMPLNVSQVMESLSNLYNNPGSDPLGNAIAFVGAKGGAGASTVCHNTAWAISQDIMSDVVIVDLDLPFGTAGLDFNQDPVQGIADALLSPERLDEVLLDRLLSRCSEYLSTVRGAWNARPVI
jgi:pilus assembly protein CpaE